MNQEWNYISKTKESSGYEDVIDELKNYKPEEYSLLSFDKKEDIIQRVFQIYRSKNIYPITYYNDDGVISEIKKCVEKEIVWDGKNLDFRYLQGNNLCRFLFPNIERVNIKTSKKNSMCDRFYDDDKLIKAIRLCLGAYKESPTPIGILRAMRAVGGMGVASNFHPMKAKAIYEKFVPVNGIIYDYACGFGGRMLGALCSKNNYRYFGVEPNTETFSRLNILGDYIESATERKNIYKVYCSGSEEYFAKEEYCDFAFSSPPYFNLEKYCDEITQCYNKFNQIDDWFIGYVKPTIQNIYKMLKKNSYYGVNIADFRIGNKQIAFVDAWIRESLEAGFVFHEEITMKLQRRRGSGHKENGIDKPKSESVYIFKKD